MAKSVSEEEEELPSSSEILRLLASPDEPLTGEIMEMFSHRIKSDVHCISIDEFIILAQRKCKHNGAPIPVCDARSPGEFAIGHIPGATNVPLFTNEERATVGKLYNTAGRSSAMVMGMSIVRPKLDALVSTAADIVANRLADNTNTTTNRTGDNSDDDSDRDDDNVLLLHCWRGGMRSCALAFLIQTRNPRLRVYVLKDGYKAFRKWQYNIYCYLPENASYSCDENVHVVNTNGLLCHRKGKIISHRKKLKMAAREASASGIGIAKREAAIAKVRARRMKDAADVDVVAAEVQRKADADASARAEVEWADRFDQGPRIAIIAGPTGSGKTKVLHALRDVLGEQIIDLEGLANHSGSAFGFVGHAPQPTPQQYTNDIAMQWNSLDPERWVFIEDEGPHVGSVNLPVGLYRKMRTASAVLKLEIPKDIRVEVLREDYALPEKKDGSYTDQDLSEWLCNMIEATQKLEKRIGQVRMDMMITMLRDGHFAEFASAALEYYYDDLYDKHINNEHGSANMKGGGERAAAISSVTVDNMEGFDAEAVARQVLTSLSLLKL